MPIVSYEADAMASEAYAQLRAMFHPRILSLVYETLRQIDEGKIDGAGLVRLRDYHTLFLLSCGLAVSVMVYGTPHAGLVHIMEHPLPADDPGDYGGLDVDVVERVHEELGIPREFLKDVQAFRESLLLGQASSAEMYMAEGDCASCYLLSAALMLHRFTTGADIRVFSARGHFHEVVED